MKLIDFYEVLKNAEDEHEDGIHVRVIGVRFEELKREVGDICGNSRHNLDRDDERDMPDYGSDEYEKMFELDGASSFGVTHLMDDIEYLVRKNPEKSINEVYAGSHCYIIGGKYTTNESDAIDEGELVIEDAEVLEVIY